MSAKAENCKRIPIEINEKCKPQHPTSSQLQTAFVFPEIFPRFAEISGRPRFSRMAGLKLMIVLEGENTLESRTIKKRNIFQ
jgi:hypothetical protein